MRTIAVEYRSVQDLKPHARNARVHPKKQIAALAKSIREFGFVNPVLVDEEGELIAGHGRLLAAKSLRMDEVPTVVIRGLSDVQKRALRIADNKLPQGAAWDQDLLGAELEALSNPALNFDVSFTAFSPPEVDQALRKLRGKVDEAPAKPWSPPTGVHAGDIWLLGKHRIACGDCRDEALMKRLMMDGKADAAFLDPPYNVPIAGFAVSRGTHADFSEAVGEMSPEQFTGFLRDTLGAAAAVTRSGGVHFVAMDWRHMVELQAAGASTYNELLNVCVWNKSNAGMGSLYRSKHELIFVFRVGNDQHFNAVELGRHGRHRTNVWDYSSVNSFSKARRGDLKFHPTVKPVQMVADALMDVTRPRETVLDCFLGSGTTLLAAEQIGRVFRGVEMDPGYVEVALDRWARMTCQTPVLEGTGQTLEEVQLSLIDEAI